MALFRVDRLFRIRALLRKKGRSAAGPAGPDKDTIAVLQTETEDRQAEAGAEPETIVPAGTGAEPETIVPAEPGANPESTAPAGTGPEPGTHGSAESGPEEKEKEDAAMNTHTEIKTQELDTAEEKAAEDMTTEIRKAEAGREENTAKETFEEEVITEENISEENIAEENIAEESATEEAVASETIAKEAAAKETSADTPVAEEPVKEEPVWTREGVEDLEPFDVFAHFRKIASIPHGSFHTEEISDHLEQFAKKHGFDYYRDDMGNLIIRRQGSAGFEDRDPVALQGHIDMVLAKEASKDIDLETQPITLLTDGEWLTADRTTLGADNGIAVAMMLALLADESLKCPPLECIFTVDEEVGLLGAEGLDLSSLNSRRMINLDSEDEGIITAGCAGGAQEICTLPGRKKLKEGIPVTIEIGGLLGGHSGDKIGENRANAILLLARLLYKLTKVGKFYIVSMSGGERDNAIPRNAQAHLLFKGKTKKEDIKAAVEKFSSEVKREYSVTDPGVEVRLSMPENRERERKEAFTRKDSLHMIRFLMAFPNGLIEYIPGQKEIPQTSLSLGILTTLDKGICVQSLVRSSLNSRKRMLMDRIECIAEEFGATLETTGAYPAWELVRDSDFRRLAAETYRKVTGSKAQVTVTHGGLECGLLSAKVPGLDCISIGPDMEDIHTPGERLNVASTARTYAYLRELLAACADL